uniref:Endoplasmic reticulum vesicle transporter C-terminal domain-containing protein n=1 Tax=Odontella aurita TaxID=265563 RepID=A0A7S4IKK9_9STRA
MHAPQRQPPHGVGGPGVGAGPASASSSSGGFAERLRSLDAHTPAAAEFRVRTIQGALLSVFTLLSIAYLVRIEYGFHFLTEVLDRVHVNATTPAGLEMEFDITFHSVPCALLNVDAQDPTGQSQSLHLDRTHRVFKHRINKNGKMIGRKSKFELGGTFADERSLRDMGKEELGLEDEKEEVEGTASDSSDEDECGDCYGAGEEGECCNTCDDVKRAYQRRSWHIDLAKVKQCRKDVKSADEEGEGCNVHGTVALSTGGGNLHLAPGRGLEKFGKEKQDADFVTSLTEFIEEAFETFNVSHTVNRIRFGQEYPGDLHQLDGQKRIVEDDYGMYQYYVQVVPTVYRKLDGTEIATNQYSVTEHMRHVTPGSGRGLPGVFIFYEVSALHVEMEEYRRGWIRFLTSVCAAVGGVFTVMGMADRAIFARSRSTGAGLG